MTYPPFRREPVTTPSLFAGRLRELGLNVPNPDGEPWWVTDAAYVIDAAASEALLEAATGIQKRRMYSPHGVPGPTSVNSGSGSCFHTPCRS